jgi:hypothetical protein
MTSSKLDDYALKQVAKLKYLLGGTVTEDGKKIEKI